MLAHDLLVGLLQDGMRGERILGLLDDHLLLLLQEQGGLTRD